MVFGKDTQPASRLSPAGCLFVGNVIKEIGSGRQTGVPPGKILSEVIMDEVPFKDLPEDLKTLLKLSAVVVVKPGAQEPPEQLEAGFNEFCFSKKGSVPQMNQALKGLLGVGEEEEI